MADALGTSAERHDAMSDSPRATAGEQAGASDSRDGRPDPAYLAQPAARGQPGELDQQQERQPELRGAGPHARPQGAGASGKLEEASTRAKGAGSSAGASAGAQAAWTGDPFVQLRDALVLCIAATKPELVDQLDAGGTNLRPGRGLTELHRRTQLLLYTCRVRSTPPTQAQLRELRLIELLSAVHKHPDLAHLHAPCAHLLHANVWSQRATLVDLLPPGADGGVGRGGGAAPPWGDTPPTPGGGPLSPRGAAPAPGATPEASEVTGATGGDGGADAQGSPMHSRHAGPPSDAPLNGVLPGRAWQGGGADGKGGGDAQDAAGKAAAARGHGAGGGGLDGGAPDTDMHLGLGPLLGVEDAAAGAEGGQDGVGGDDAGLFSPSASMHMSGPRGGGGGGKVDAAS